MKAFNVLAMTLSTGSQSKPQESRIISCIEIYIIGAMDI